MGPETTSYEIVGGPCKIENEFGPNLGCLTDSVLLSIESNGAYWLILDEINRADITACLSPALGALEINDGKIFIDQFFIGRPKSGKAIPVPGTFRIIGTMNTFDADQLFLFSEALRRRISFVSIGTLSQNDEIALISNKTLAKEAALGQTSLSEVRSSYLKFSLSDLTASILDIVNRVRALVNSEPAFLFKRCDIGSAIVIDIVSSLWIYARRHKVKTIEKLQSQIDTVFCSMLFGNLEGRNYDELVQLRDSIFDKGNYPECWRILDSHIHKMEVF